MNPASQILSDSPHAGRGLYRYAVGVLVCTLVLIKLGAMVTSTGSGMAFLDWPLANGSLWPPHMDLAGFFEHFHRVVGATVGLSVLVLAIWIARAEPRRWLRRLASGLLGLVVLQGIIGGLGVLNGLPYATSITHGVLAQVILCLLALVAFALSNAWSQRTPVAAERLRRGRRLATLALALVFAQLLVGAVLRHTNLPGLLWLHVFMAIGVALVILCAALYCGTRFAHAPGFTRLSHLVLGALLLQLLLGFVTLMVRRVKDPSNIDYLGRSLLVSLHVVVGALLFLSAALLLYRVMRNMVPEPPRSRAAR